MDGEPMLPPVLFFFFIKSLNFWNKLSMKRKFYWPILNHLLIYQNPLIIQNQIQIIKSPGFA